MRCWSLDFIFSLLSYPDGIKRVIMTSKSKEIRGDHLTLLGTIVKFFPDAEEYVHGLPFIHTFIYSFVSFHLRIHL